MGVVVALVLPCWCYRDIIKKDFQAFNEASVWPAVC